MISMMKGMDLREMERSVARSQVVAATSVMSSSQEAAELAMGVLEVFSVFQKRWRAYS